MSLEPAPEDPCDSGVWLCRGCLLGKKDRDVLASTFSTRNPSSSYFAKWAVFFLLPNGRLFTDTAAGLGPPGLRPLPLHGQPQPLRGIHSHPPPHTHTFQCHLSQVPGLRAAGAGASIRQSLCRLLAHFTRFYFNEKPHAGLVCMPGLSHAPADVPSSLPGLGQPGRQLPAEPWSPPLGTAARGCS